MSDGASTTSPRIYVACIAAYNNGYLHGGWIDADQDTDAIRAKITAMLARSPVEGAEEFAIHDCEGFEGVSISEYAGIDSVARIAAFIAEHGKLGAGVLEQFSSSIDEAETALGALQKLGRDWIDIELDNGHDHAAGKRLALP